MNSPTVSRICQNRPRSRYSKPWIPIHFQPLPRRNPWMLASSPSQAAEDHDGERAEQPVGEHVLPARFAAGDHRREEDPGREERRRRPRRSPAAGARCGRGCRAATAARSTPKKPLELGAVVLRAAPPISVWTRNSAAITRKNHAVARWAGVSATSPGVRKDSVVGLPAVPAEPVVQRPKAANRAPIPPSSATSDSTLQTIDVRRSACCRRAARAASCWCRSSSCPGRLAAAAHARPGEVGRRAARISSGSVIAFGREPVLGPRVAEERRRSARAP